MPGRHTAQLYRDGYAYAYSCSCGWEGQWGSMASAGADLVRHMSEDEREERAQ